MDRAIVRSRLSGLMPLVAIAALLSLTLDSSVLAAEAAKPAAAPLDGAQWLEEAADVPYAVTGALANGKNTVATLRLEAEGSKVVLQLQKGQAQFLASAGGKMAPIGAAGKLSNLGTDPHPFTVHRTAWQLTLIAGGEIICRGYSLAPESEKVGWNGGASLGDLRVQPLGKIEFTDDFTRVAGAASTGTWEVAHGKWGQKALREDVQAAQMDASKSTNPFSYFGETSDASPAIAVTGYWFWRDYLVSAAVRGGSDSVIGLVACYQNPKNYLAVEWHSKIAADDADVLRLIAVEDSKPRVLKEMRGGFLPGTWYRLGLGYSDGHLAAFVDGVTRMSVETDAMGQGQAGVMTSGQGGDYFDDVEAEDWSIFRDDFTSPEPGRWAASSGKWDVSGGAMKLTCSGDASAIAGEPDWPNYLASVSLKGTASSAGLMVDAGGEKPVLVAVRGGRSPSLAILTREAADKPWQEMVSVPCSSLSSKPARLWVHVEDGLVVSSFGKATVQAFVANCHGGRLALYGRDAKGLAFGGVAVDFISPPKTSHTTKEFTNINVHFEMVEWASRRHAWVPAALAAVGAPEGSVAGQWWSKGDYRGHYDVDFPLAGIGSRDFSLTLVLDGDPSAKDSGVTIVLSGKKDQKSIHFTVKAAGKIVAEKDFTPEGAEAQIQCSRLGEFIAISVGDECIFDQRLIPGKGEPVAARPTGEEKPK